MTRSAAQNQELFDKLLAQWRERDEAIDKLNDTQIGLSKRITELFSESIVKEKMLADLPWKFKTHDHHAVSLYCNSTLSKVGEFLEKMHWDNGGFYWGRTLSISNYTVTFPGDDMNIFFNEVDECIAFCKEHGIKPNVTKLNDQRNAFQIRLDNVTSLIESLS